VTKSSTQTGRTEERHPFGELLAQYRARKPGLTQTRLAHLAGYDQAILVRMCQGKKDLTGPSGRERIVRLIETLAEQGALTMLDEANALLLTATMPPLFEHQPIEAKLIAQLGKLPAGHRVRRTNLPAPLASFVGRAQEIADVRRLLKNTRLLTLTGSGGAGKTRLAQQAAADVLLLYPDGVWYVELAALQDGAMIADAMARTLGLSTTDQPALAQACDFLREKHVLLVLDNCEHLIDDAAAFAITVLQACPRVTILTTSREALNVEGETTWRVPPMQLDEAAELFVTRAQATRGDTRLNERDATVAHICSRLDGMPLAIELAAARLNALSLSDIAAGLDDRFNLLAHGRRGALPRHQTLRAMIDWSHELLSENEKIVFRRLGIFVGGWTLEDAAQVVSVDGFPATHAQLISKSLATVDEANGVTRYRYLETIREYALEKLTEAGELDATRRRHAEAFMQLAEASVHPIRRKEQPLWVKRFQREQGNYRAALDWCFSAGNRACAPIGCRVVGALNHYWMVSGQYSADQKRWVTCATEVLHDEMPLDVQAWVWLAADNHLRTVSPYSRRALALFQASGNRADELIAKGFVARTLFYELNYEAAIAMHETAVKESREYGDTWVLRFNLGMLADGLRYGRVLNRLEAIYAELLALARADGDMQDAANTLLIYISGAAKERLDWEAAARYDKEAAELAHELNSPELRVRAQFALAEDIRHLGEPDRAIALLEDCVSYAQEHSAGFALIQASCCLARAVNAAGNPIKAQALLDEVLRHSRQNKMGVYYLIFDSMTAIAAACGDAVRCVRFRGLADQLMEKVHHYRRPNLEWELAPYIDKARATLGDEAFDAAYAEGRAMTLDEAIAYALGDV
jgi:predicted ATPase